MPYVYEPRLGKWVEVDEQTAQEQAAQGYSVVGTAGAAAGGQGNVAPETTSLYQLLNYLLSAQDRVNNQNQTAISGFNADTQRMQTQGSNAAALSNAWFQARGPKDWAQMSNLGVNGGGNVLDFVAALNGQMGEGPLTYGHVNEHQQMKNRLTPQNSGILSLFNGGGGGASTQGGTGSTSVSVNGQPVAGPGAASGVQPTSTPVTGGHAGQPAAAGAPGAVFLNGQWVYPTVQADTSAWHKSSNHSEIEWKRKLEQAGIPVGDANPDQVRAAKRGDVGSQALRDMQDGRYGMSNRALPYDQALQDVNAPGAQPGSGGAAPGVRLTNGNLPGTPGAVPVADNGQRFPVPAGMSTSPQPGQTGTNRDTSGTQTGQGGTSQPNNNVNAGAVTQTGSMGVASRDSAAVPQTGATPADQKYGSFYNSNPVMHAASQYGTPANAQDMGDNQIGHVTRVTYADGTQRYFKDDGTEVQQNPNANQAGQGLYLPKAVTQATAGAPGPKPPSPLGASGRDSSAIPNRISTGAASRDSSAIPNPSDGMGLSQEQMAARAQQQQAQDNAANGSGNSSDGSGSSSDNPNVVNGRDQSGYQPKSAAEAASDRARRREEERATGGIDVIKHPTHILAGEGGKKELHVIVPLENPNVPVPQWVKNLAATVEPGKIDSPQKHFQMAMAEGGAVATNDPYAGATAHLGGTAPVVGSVDPSGQYVCMGYDADGQPQWAALAEVASGSVNQTGQILQPTVAPESTPGTGQVFPPNMPLDTSQIDDQRSHLSGPGYRPPPDPAPVPMARGGVVNTSGDPNAAPLDAPMTLPPTPAPTGQMAPMGNAPQSPQPGQGQLLALPNPDGTYRVVDLQTGQTVTEHATLEQVQALVKIGAATIANQGGAGAPTGTGTPDKPLAMKGGGAVAVTPPDPTVPPVPSGGVMSPDAKIYSANRPFNVRDLSLAQQSAWGVGHPKLAKTYDVSTQPQFTNAGGQTQVLTGPNHWKQIPAWQNVPLISPEEASARVVSTWGPLEEGLWSSILGAQGDTLENWKFRLAQNLPPQAVPGLLRPANRW